MILHKVTFGPVPSGRRREAEDALESYISVLLHNGQACGEYFHVVQGGKLCAYVNLAGLRALAPKYRSRHEADCLKKVVEIFKGPPKWTLADDEVPARDPTWTRSPFLYLFAHIFDWEPPLCRGDTGEPIPLYRLPGTHEDREEIHFWQQTYHDYDRIWIRSGELEMPVYRQLASPDSELSQQGREICARIESVTGIPTYYFLLRYWGRKEGEEARRCPGCGRPWRTEHPVEHRKGHFCHFAFQCRKCRLVSHAGDTYDGARRARIGDWPAPGTPR